LTIENAQDSILGASINDLAGTESGEVGVWVPDIDGAIREVRIVRKLSQLSPDSIEETYG
jgi:hypothetical protein